MDGSIQELIDFPGSGFVTGVSSVSDLPCPLPSAVRGSVQLPLQLEGSHQMQLPDLELMGLQNQEPSKPLINNQC